MELHQLRCFQVVVEEGGFKRATTRLHLTQPALSYQIKQLEQELGTSLFHRRPGGVSPTEAGRTFYEHALLVMEAVRRARQAVDELAEGVVGDVRIGTVNSVGIYFLPQVLLRLREKHPGVRPTVLYRDSNEIIEALLSNRVDLALVANPNPDRRLKQELVIEEQVSLVCGYTHPFFGRPHVRPSELRGVQFVSLSQDSPTGELILRHLSRLGVNVEPVVSTENVETVKKMCEVGLGVAFVPDMVTSQDVCCDDHTNGRLSRASVGPPLVRKINLVTWKKHELGRAVEAFNGELRKVAATWKACLDLDPLTKDYTAA